MTRSGGSSRGPSATARLRELVGSRVRLRTATGGYLDALPPSPAGRQTIAQLAMEFGPLQRIYDGLWRPVLFTAWTGRSQSEETQAMLDALRPEPGQVLVDVACGPGTTTRRLASAVAPHGLVVGVDLAPGMLAEAVEQTDDPTVAYLRADGADLPLPDASVDGAACFGALYLVAEPEQVMAELVRVLRPGGRISILTTCARGPRSTRGALDLSRKASGIRIFGRSEITDELTRLGIVQLRSDVRRYSQLVSGIKS